MKINVTNILLAAIGLLLLLQWQCKSKPVNDSYKETVAAKDEFIFYLQQDRLRDRKEHDAEISRLLKQDTVLVKEYRTNTIKYEKIPSVINDYNRDELRREFTNY